MKNMWNMISEKKMNIFSLRFNGDLEGKFQADYFQNSLMYLRVSFLMGVFFFSAFAWLDYRVSDDYLLFWMIRFSIVIPSILLVFILSYSRNFYKYWQMVISISIMIAGLGILAMIAIGGKPVDRTYYVGFGLVLIYGYVLIKQRFVYSFFCSLFMTIIYFVIMQYSDIPDLMKFNNGFFLIALNLTVMLSGYLLEYYTRESFLNRYELMEQKSKVEEANQNLEIKISERTQKIRSINSELHRQITKLQNTKKALSESEMQFRMAFESTNSAVWSVDLVTYDFSSKDIYQKLLNYPASFIPHGDFFEEVDIDDVPVFLKQLENVKDGLEEYIDLDLRMKNIHGDYRWLHFWGKISVDEPNEENIAIIGTAMDIHKRKSDELELEKIKANLEHAVQERTSRLMASQKALIMLTEDVNDTSIELAEANKQLASLNDELESFSYSVSHDLKAPLRSMNGFAGTLLMDYKDKLDAEGIECLEYIKNSALLMGRLIEDLLEFSRLGRSRIETTHVDMGIIFNEVLEDTQKVYPDQEIYGRIPKLPVVLADATLIRQVVVNLLSNAVKFSAMRDKSIITVKYKLTEKEHEFSIRDNGVGFNMEYRNKLFGVFQRLHNPDEFKGYGVGLSLVKKIILKHGGRVWAHSEPEKGATFSFTIPVEKKLDKNIDIKSLVSEYDGDQDEQSGNITGRR